MGATTSPDFRELFESSPGLYLVFSPDLRIIAASNAYLRFVSLKREELLGRGPESMPLESREAVRSSLERVIQTRATDVMPLQERTENSASHYWKPINIPHTGSDGVISHIIHELQDVSELIRLKKLEGEQREVSDQWSDRFFSVSLDMLCISSYDGHFKKVNPAFEKVLGFDAAELCSKSYLDFIHPDDIDRTKREVEKQLSRNETVFSFENRYRCKDGSYKILSWKSAPVGSFMYAAARDVTESRKIEEELRLAKEESEIANRELESFSYSVAHDLRTPLRSMIGFTKILLEDHSASFGAEAKNILLRVITASQRMGLLVDGLLDLSRISRKDFTKKEVNLSALVREITVDLWKTDVEREVDFTIAEGVTASGDPVLLKLALTNLLDNAWKYTSKAKRPIKIEFGVMEADGERVFYIRDNGVGFDMKYSDKLFGTFQRLHSVGEFEGTGIGLATVQRIIYRHGGKIWAIGKIDEGATFFFTL